MGVWHGQGCGLRAAFFFHVFFEILFYSVMQEHTGARDGGVARQGGGGLMGAQKKIFSIFFSNFFYFLILLCGGGNMSAVVGAEKIQKISKIFKKNFI